MVRPEQLGAEFVLLRWKFFAVWKEFFPEFSWDRTPLACMWWPLDGCCTLEACAPRNPGRLRVSTVNYFGRGYAAPGSSISICAAGFSGSGFEGSRGTRGVSRPARGTREPGRSIR